MKRLSYLLLFVAVSLTACKKKYCWDCTTETNLGGTITSNTASYCDMTEDDINDKRGSGTVQVTQGGKTATATTNTTCEKQQ